MADTITLKGMRFHTLVGVYPHEAEFPQPIEVDLSVDIEESKEIVDYSKLYDLVAAIFQSGHIGYLEEIAERIAAVVLGTSGVQTARVSVRKPHVALAGPLDYAELSIVRPRSNAN